MLSVSCKELALRESWQSRQALTERVYAALTNSELSPSVYTTLSPCRKAPARKRAAAQITVWQLSAPIVSLPSLKVLPEQIIRRPQILRQALQGFLLQLRRHPVKGFGNAAGDTGKGVAVAAEGDRIIPLATRQNRLLQVSTTGRSPFIS